MASELEHLVKDMDSQSVLENLQNLIDQTFVIEKEYESLKDDYDHLQATIENVVEAQPNAMWVLDKDNQIFLQNDKAKALPELFKELHLHESEYEVNFEEGSYLIKMNQIPEKTILSATDITEQKRKESLATMGQMAAHLSHEIRNPIGSIALLTSSLLKRVKTENKPVVFEIQKAIFRIERIINATLMFSKGVAATKQSFQLSDISEALDSAVSYYSFTKAIDFDFDFPQTLIEADKELLVMVFSNFVFNAIDAIEEDDLEEGSVQIRYRKDAREHHFTIIDSGVPIENPKELFEAFKSTKEKGNGLGLVLSKQIIACHDGTIALLEDGNKGFIITIPLADKEPLS
ncbi:MAG: HAMP domain-containing histidine kinase [Thiovulaceae bacterium]|nr:HAMP domain-containing histidine kinase [Sulfurimonadaceae bacterium]